MLPPGSATADWIRPDRGICRQAKNVGGCCRSPNSARWRHGLRTRWRITAQTSSTHPRLHTLEPPIQRAQRLIRKLADRLQRMIRRNPLLQPYIAEQPLAPIIPSPHRKLDLSMKEVNHKKGQMGEFYCSLSGVGAELTGSYKAEIEIGRGSPFCAGSMSNSAVRSRVNWSPRKSGVCLLPLPRPCTRGFSLAAAVIGEMVTCSQSCAHFLRHAKGGPQTAHVLVGRSDYLCILGTGHSCG